jgi:hypothetical protein
MNEQRRETLGAIWSICEQMAYTAEHGHVATLEVLFNSLKRQMAKLEKAKEDNNGIAV